jgi:hypothetical protein
MDFTSSANVQSEKAIAVRKLQPCVSMFLCFYVVCLQWRYAEKVLPSNAALSHILGVLKFFRLVWKKKKNNPIFRHYIAYIHKFIFVARRGRGKRPLCKQPYLKRAPSKIWDRCYYFLNIFAEKFSEKIGVFCSSYCQFCKNCDHNIGFWEKRQFFAENCQKSQKIVNITSTPGICSTLHICSPLLNFADYCDRDVRYWLFVENNVKELS